MRIEEYLHAAMVDKGRSTPVQVVECDGPGDVLAPPDPTETPGGSDER